MKNSLLLPDKDPMGRAIAEFYEKGKAAKLRVFSSQFDEDEIPVKHLFRTYDEMSPMEQKALNLAQGKILDCGAGSGCHALALQDMGKDVDAIDISPLSVEVMEKRGVQNASQVDLFHHTAVQKYDTVLMLMNGSGIIGKIENMGEFFTKMKQILKPGGVVYTREVATIFTKRNSSVVNFNNEYMYGYYDKDNKAIVKNLNYKSRHTFNAEMDVCFENYLGDLDIPINSENPLINELYKKLYSLEVLFAKYVDDIGFEDIKNQIRYYANCIVSLKNNISDDMVLGEASLNENYEKEFAM